MIYHARPENLPAILFENIAGYAPGFRVLSGMTTSPQRLALDSRSAHVKAPLDIRPCLSRTRMKNFDLVDNLFVNAGPVLENVDRERRRRPLQVPRAFSS